MKSDSVKKGVQRAPHRSLLRACGVKDEDFDKPFIGIANSFTEIVPGHIHLRELVEYVKEGAEQYLRVTIDNENGIDIKSILANALNKNN